MEKMLSVFKINQQEEQKLIDRHNKRLERLGMTKQEHQHQLEIMRNTDHHDFMELIKMLNKRYSQ